LLLFRFDEFLFGVQGIPLRHWHPHRPKEAVIPDFSGVTLRRRLSRVPLIVRNLLRELSLYAASVSKALGWLVIATLPEWPSVLAGKFNMIHFKKQFTVSNTTPLHHPPKGRCLAAHLDK
jgi:hypothetical protein